MGTSLKASPNRGSNPWWFGHSLQLLNTLLPRVVTAVLRLWIMSMRMEFILIKCKWSIQCGGRVHGLPHTTKFKKRCTMFFLFVIGRPSKSTMNVTIMTNENVCSQAGIKTIKKHWSDIQNNIVRPNIKVKMTMTIKENDRKWLRNLTYRCQHIQHGYKNSEIQIHSCGREYMCSLTMQDIWGSSPIACILYLILFVCFLLTFILVRPISFLCFMK